MTAVGRFLPDGLPRTCRSNAIISESIENVGRTVNIDPSTTFATGSFAASGLIRVLSFRSSDKIAVQTRVRRANHTAADIGDGSAGDWRHPITRDEIAE
jgi:hypothetical protein